MQRIQDFVGAQYFFKESGYDERNWEYASSSHQQDHNMFPGLIAYPENDEDIQGALLYANDNKYPVSIMSGGHQYSGACSTDPNGIQLNLQSTYKGLHDLAIFPSSLPANDDKVLVNASVSQSLGDFNTFLKDNELFVPHGQCTDVHLGGHVQTGGYGQLARSFGLLGDHIWGLRIICYDGNILEINRTVRADLLNAILGGSPGNFGVITHYIIEVYRDRDYYFPEKNAVPHGFKAVWLYSEKVLKALLGEVARMGDDSNFPRNYDLCVSVLSHSFKLLALEPGLVDYQDELHERYPEYVPSKDSLKMWPSVIVVYAQWVPIFQADSYTSEVDAWFQRFRDLATIFNLRLRYWDLVLPMSKMTGEWLFNGPREFDYPYNKRANVTNSRTLVKDNWVDAAVQQISKVVLILHPEMWYNCFVSAQIQCFGGNNSQFFVNRNNGTSYSWRDTTVGQTLDCFHRDSDYARELAQDWQDDNQNVMISSKS